MAKLDNVQGINCDDEMVETLKLWLSLAKQGRLTALTACLIIDDEIDSEQIYGQHSVLEMLAMSHITTSQMTNAYITSEDED